MAWVIEMTEKCYTCNAQSQQRQEENLQIIVPWINSSSSHEVRRSSEHVLAQSDGANILQDAVKRTEGDARASYKIDQFASLVPPGSEEFVQIMIQQGCFTLLVALRSLGYTHKLGLGWSETQIKRWMLDLFGIWNQVPLVVLKELMKQSFFQEVLGSKKMKRPMDLPRMIFYDHLVNPNPGSPGSLVILTKRLLSFLGFRGLSHQEPHTLLHALWLLLTGPGTGDAKDDGDEDDSDNNSLWSTVRSATELKEENIIFKSKKGMGTRGIQFKEKMFEEARLYLPSISIEPDTEKLFGHLIDYEEETMDKNRQREVCAYLKLMLELVRTPDDAKVLATQGIINALPEQEKDLPEMLRRLKLPQMGNNNNLEVVRQKIRRYVKPSTWAKVKNLIVVGLILTLLQTIYAIVGYHHPKK